LPYIQRFQGQTFVVKISGKVTENPENLSSLAEELALLHQVGIRICVVHGGGKQLSELASRMGIEQTIIEGRRVTDDATLEMAKMIFAGKINIDILSALRNRGIEAVGLSGVDGNIVHATRRPPKEIVNRETGARESQTTWHKCVSFGRTAEYAATLTKGAHLQIIGEIQTREYVAKDGAKKSVTEIRVQRIARLDRAPKAETTEGAAA